MKLPRMSIARLMGFVLVSALGLVGLMRPDELWASLAFTAACVFLIALDPERDFIAPGEPGRSGWGSRSRAGSIS